MDDMKLNCELIIKRNNEIVNTFSYNENEKSYKTFVKALSYVVNKTHDIAIEGLKLVDVEKQEIVTHTYEYTFSGDILDYIYIW